MIVYIYRRKHLEQIFEDRDYQKLLTKMGYTKMYLVSLLAQLTFRLETHSEFPHETGVFLGTLFEMWLAL